MNEIENIKQNLNKPLMMNMKWNCCETEPVMILNAYGAGAAYVQIVVALRRN